MYVLDSSAFINEFHVNEATASIPGVREELEDESAYRFDAQEGAGMRIHIPDPESIERIRRAARDRGDLDALSDTDVRLLAAAFELEATLVTDDYAVQNVATMLEIPIQSVEQDGIEEERDWRFMCEGCGREFDEQLERCPVCGSDLTRKRPTNA